MPVITLSREFGTGGGVIGRRVAEILGADFLDAKLCEEVARRLQLPEETVHRWDERGEGLIIRLMRALQTAHPEFPMSGASSDVVMPALSEADRIWATEQEVIREQARVGPAVIVGRGGVFLFAGRPDTFHFRLVASKVTRIRRICEQTGWSPEECARRADAADRERMAFLKRQFNADPRDPLHYAMVLNTGVLGLEEVAQIIVRVAQSSTA